MPEYRGLVGGSDVSQSQLANAERTINFYIERSQSPFATHKWALYPTPGVTAIAAHTSPGGRGHFYEDGREFAVIGS